MENNELLTLTADIVSAHVSNNQVATGDIAGLVERVYNSLSGLGQQSEPAPVEKVPVVSARASVKPDYLVCMKCGKKQKTLKRHLQTAHGMTPEQYRQEFGLAPSYPMVAETYSARRRDLAKQIGLGRKPGDSPKKRAAAAPAKPKPAAAAPAVKSEPAAAAAPAKQKRAAAAAPAKAKPAARKPRVAKSKANGEAGEAG